MIHPTSAERQRGFSLAEVLVAIALLSVILLALFALVTAGVHRAYGGRKMTEASTLAEAVMERANIAVPQDNLNVGAVATTRTITWTKTGPSAVTPAAEGGAGAPAERDAWRSLLLNSSLPNSSTLTVTMTAMPSSATSFANASMVRIAVDVTWAERGTRSRKVHIETFNVPAAI